MGYKELVQDLIRSAEAKSEGVLKRAHEEAERLKARAAEDATQTEREFREALAREVDRERSKRMSRIRMESRAILLQARRSLSEEVFTQLENRLRRLPQERDYSRLVAQLYQEILAEFPEGNVTVRADAKATTVLQSLIKDRTARFEPLPKEEYGGLEVSDESGKVLIRNTLRARLLKARPQLMIEINQWLSSHD